MASESVEETIKRICTHKGVEGVLVSNYEGVALKSTLSASLTNKYAGLMAHLVVKARSVVRDIDAEVRAARRLCNRTPPLATACAGRLAAGTHCIPSHPPPPQDDLVFLRARTKKHEIMIAPDKEYLLIVVQNPT